MLEILRNGEARLTSHFHDGECDDRSVHYFDLNKTVGAQIRESGRLAWIFLDDHYGLHPSPAGSYSCASSARRDFNQILDALDGARCGEGQDATVRPGDPQLHALVSMPNHSRTPAPAQPSRRPGLKRAMSYGAVAFLVLAADRLTSTRLWGGGEDTHAVQHSAAVLPSERQPLPMQGSTAAMQAPFTPQRAIQMPQRFSAPAPAEVPAAGPAQGSSPVGLNPPPASPQ